MFNQKTVKMAKRKVVNSRRVARDKKSGGGKSSKYAQKVEQQKAGRYSADSPFSVHEGGPGLSVAETNRRRFNTYKKAEKKAAE